MWTAFNKYDTICSVTNSFFNCRRKLYFKDGLNYVGFGHVKRNMVGEFLKLVLWYSLVWTTYDAIILTMLYSYNILLANKTLCSYVKVTMIIMQQVWQVNRTIQLTRLYSSYCRVLKELISSFISSSPYLAYFTHFNIPVQVVDSFFISTPPNACRIWSDTYDSYYSVSHVSMKLKDPFTLLESENI